MWPSANWVTIARVSLVREIQDAAQDSSVNLPDLLRKCKVLAARLKHAEFAAWVSNELNGYAEETDLPGYRSLKTQSRGTFVGTYGRQAVNVSISARSIPEQFRSHVEALSCRQSVSALDDLVKATTGDLQAPWDADLILYCQRHVTIFEGMTLLNGWRTVGRAEVRAILDTVRTRILDFVLAIEDEAPDAGETPPGAPPPISQGAVTQIFNNNIYGGQSNIGMSGGTAQLAMGDGAFSPAIPTEIHDELRQELAALRSKLESLSKTDRDDATDALARVEAELAAPTPDIGRVERYLGMLGNITTIVEPHVANLTILVARIASSMTGIV